MEWYEILRELREETEPRLSQEAVAAKLNMTQRKLSRMETGTSNPDIEDIRLICKYYNISADYLIGLTKEKKICPKK
ncbi:helix-turn-helix domain-containing protein [Acetivibrio sp. MSJd-27]|jgi:transcriptional regulator, XRE family|uniref:helix-turn-helix domain-containing protein n=1 Tax=Acetivibrio sp. MSJd-27 TaxID=2841523 RepID=UPI0015AD019D|nr:helix-turn-helix transcriptional regulator [Acetivibrio sp. MSJd-27]MBU5451413.1 helix-turn-helix domain-containing protein [Acetivibrio sp. MSJd-27]